MRSRVSGKKRKTIIVISLVLTLLIIAVLVWKLSSYTKSLKMDFDSVGLNCNSATVLSDGNINEAISGGILPDTLVTEEVKTVLKDPSKELCVIWLEYSINSEKELDEGKFLVDINPTRNIKGKIYSYTPVTDAKKEGNKYTFRQGLLLDKTDVKNFLLEKELPRPFKGPCSFELSYTVKGSGKTTKIGFHADNQL